MTKIIVTNKMIPYAIIVSGSRSLMNPALVGALVIHGAQTGADMIAHEAALLKGMIPVAVPYFDWLGPAGGPARNRVMVHMLSWYRRHGVPVAVEAFPTHLSRGTWSLVGFARTARLPITITRVPTLLANAPE